ncbi:MAG: heavy metal translocating P-type ATPase metal-binding domain-containing protein [Bacteroidota bacterium]
MPETIVNQEISCYHCGENCDETILHQEKYFCCQGCKTVYELIASNDLETYYQLNDAPGVRQNRNNTDFDYLDNEAIAGRLLDFQSGTISRVSLSLPDIHCSSCIWLLENLPTFFPGIVNCQVNFVKKKAAITFRHEVLSFKELVTLISSIGYEPRISLEGDESETKRDPLVIKLAVAGFCFGNSMLISIPGYLDTGLQLTPGFKMLFAVVNIILMLPILFYAGSDYFKTAFRQLQKRQISIDVPIALGISVLFAQSIFEIVTGDGPGYADSLAGLVFFLLIGKWYQNKTYQALSFERTYKSFFPVAVNKVSPGRSVEEDSFVLLEDLKIGDRIRIRNNEIVPADSVLMEGQALIDYSFVTGESLEEKVGDGSLIYAGGRQKGAAITVQVAKEVSSGYLTDLWNQADFKKAGNQGLKNIIQRISGIFTLAILAIAVITAGVWIMIDPSMVWQTVSSVMIVACPCALALALPFAYGHGLRYLGREQLYLKNADVVEKIARVKQIVFDKTGTLTKPELVQLEWHGTPMTLADQQDLYAVCSNSMHPYSKLLTSHLKSKNEKDLSTSLQPSQFEEKEGKGILALVNEREVQIGSAAFLQAEASDQTESTIHVRLGTQYQGFYLVRNAYRSGIFDVLKKLGVNYVMHLISGDNSSERDRLYPYFHSLHFKQSPENKFTFVHQQQKESAVLMIGDGLNDAGALKMSEVGMAVTEDAHQFSPACDAIVSGDKITKLHGFIQFSKRTYDIVKVALALSLLYNLTGLYFAVTGQLTPIISAILMPLSSVSVVGLITLLMRFNAKKFFGR